MTKEMAKFLQECCENAGNECKIYEDYSGRGMYGQTTFGVVVDSPALLIADILQYLQENVREGDGQFSTTCYVGQDIPDVDSLRMDNMGLGVIFY